MSLTGIHEPAGVEVVVGGGGTADSRPEALSRSAGTHQMSEDCGIFISWLEIHPESFRENDSKRIFSFGSGLGGTSRWVTPPPGPDRRIREVQ